LFSSSAAPSRYAHVLRRTRRLAARLFLCIAMYVLAPPQWRSSSGREAGTVRRRWDDLRVIALDAASGIGRRRRYLRPLDVEQRDANGFPLGLGASASSDEKADCYGPLSGAWRTRRDHTPPRLGGLSPDTWDGLPARIPPGCALFGGSPADRPTPSTRPVAQRGCFRSCPVVAVISTRHTTSSQGCTSTGQADGSRGPRPHGEEWDG
jgi:hypothetical protein